MLVMWGLSTITGLMVIEITLSLPASSCSFSSMAEETLNTFWQFISWISFLLLLYAITWAYIAGGAAIVVKDARFYIGY